MAGTGRLRKRTQLRRSLKRPISLNLFSLHVLSTHSTYSTHLQYILAEIDRVGHRFSITVYTEEIHYLYSNHRTAHKGEGGGRGAGLIQLPALIVDADSDDH